MIEALLVWGGAALLGYAVFRLVVVLQRRLAGNPLLDFQGPGAQKNPAAPWSDQVGARVAGQLPFSLAVWEDHLRWAQRGGKYRGVGLGRLVFLAMLAGLVGLIVPLRDPAPINWLVPLLGWMTPFTWVRAAANKVRRRTVRQIPELAVLVAAEVSANAPPEEALERAAELPGPLAGLLKDAVRLAQAQGRPLLSHDVQRGTLREVFETSGLPSLRAFAVQLDMAAAKGVELAERMVEISGILAAEYRQQLMEHIEKLETNLTTAVAVFYFVPMVLLVLLPLFSEALNAF